MSKGICLLSKTFEFSFQSLFQISWSFFFLFKRKDDGFCHVTLETSVVCTEEEAFGSKGKNSHFEL